MIFRKEFENVLKKSCISELKPKQHGKIKTPPDTLS